MGTALPQAKYLIYANISVPNGSVEEEDIIGAIFGQLEGLLGRDLDLRELQDKGKIGRILVQVKNKNNGVYGKIIIPSNLDRIETSIIAAALEIVDRVGPFPAKVTIEKIVDTREEKRRRIVERAIQLLRNLEKKQADSRELILKVIEATKTAEVKEYGKDKLPAGPDVEKSDEVIIVEGRADVINLLRYGYRNAIAMGGIRIPETIIELARKKRTIAFLDGDRMGLQNLKELLKKCKIDYVAFAPQGKEVEDLTGREIEQALQNKVPVEKFLSAEKAKAEKKKPSELPAEVIEKVKEIIGSLEAIFFNEKWEELERVPVRDMIERLQQRGNVHAIVFDGIVTQRVLDAATQRGVKLIVAARIGSLSRKVRGIKILSYEDLQLA